MIKNIISHLLSLSLSFTFLLYVYNRICICPLKSKSFVDPDLSPLEKSCVVPSMHEILAQNPFNTRSIHCQRITLAALYCQDTTSSRARSSSDGGIVQKSVYVRLSYNSKLIQSRTEIVYLVVRKKVQA